MNKPSLALKGAHAHREAEAVKRSGMEEHSGVIADGEQGEQAAREARPHFLQPLVHLME